MVSKKIGSAICAILAFVAGSVFDIYILEPVVDTIVQNITCPDEVIPQQACVSTKIVLLLLPYVSFFAGAYILLIRVGVIK